MGMNLIAVCVADCIGIGLMLMLLITNRELYIKGPRFKYLVGMIFAIMFTCFADMISFMLDGNPGTINSINLYVFNSWLFLAVIVGAFLWTRLLCDCIGVKIPKYATVTMYIVDAIGILILIANLFYPLAFTLKDNVYERQTFYFVFVVIGAANIIYGLVNYFMALNKGGFVMYFSVWAFAIPMSIGIAAQSMFFGISVIWVSISVSMVGMVSSIKNELIFIDQLTGVYNRYYLEKIKSKVSKQGDVELTGIMADLNKFKQINDKCGHKVGDEALIKIASILTNAVGRCGQVIRYAGDEFVIIIRSTDKLTVLGIIDRINQGCEKFNSQNIAPYKLSVAMGYDIFNFNEQSVDEFMNAIDAKMYENKQEYHRTHQE